MEEHNFKEWFFSMFLPHVADLLDAAPVLLILDGHSSHMCLNMLQTAREKNVIIYCLPPHTTHIFTTQEALDFNSSRTKASRVDKDKFP